MPAEPVSMGLGGFLWAFCKAAWSPTGVGASGLVLYAYCDSGAQACEKLLGDEKTETSRALEAASSDSAKWDIRFARAARYGLYGFLTKYPKIYSFAVVRWALGSALPPLGALMLYDCTVIPAVAVGALAFTSWAHRDETPCAHVAAKGKCVAVAAIVAFVPLDLAIHLIPSMTAVAALASAEAYAVRPAYCVWVAHQCALPAEGTADAAAADIEGAK
eukprot:TRINITY_DN71441_c0_g1_i1.p2 TRINITY_DN71441_c0_g1~~TRINITY_DN71441_c0_g1_i1.p2  ORF type:complete len:247 (+),score=83.56 TRINITY_DN71441_c0_g1_i1:90-743(+)